MAVRYERLVSKMPRGHRLDEKSRSHSQDLVGTFRLPVFPFQLLERLSLGLRYSGAGLVCTNPTRFRAYSQTYWLSSPCQGNSPARASRLSRMLRDKGNPNSRRPRSGGSRFSHRQDMVGFQSVFTEGDFLADLIGDPAVYFDHAELFRLAEHGG